MTQIMSRKISSAILIYLLISCSSLIAKSSASLDQESSRKINPALLSKVDHELGPVIPGLSQGAIPQGLAYVKENEKIIISHYFDKKTASCLSVIDPQSGKIILSRPLKESKRKSHYGHVGGVTANTEYLWISSAGHLYQYHMQDLLNTKKKQALVPIARYKMETSASFCTLSKSTLWVGEFAYGKKYPTQKSHHITDRKGIKKSAWVCGYDIDKTFDTPSYIFSIREKVQGMHVTDKYVFLSVSYGRSNRSTIAIYKNPINTPAHKSIKLKNGKITPLWFLDGKNWIKSINFAPMTEGISIINGNLAILCESGATKYKKGGKGPIDNIIFLNLKKLLP